MTAAATGVARARRAQVAVVAVFFVHGLLFSSWTAHIPDVKSSLHIDNGALGFALLGVPIGAVSAMAVAALLIPRLGSRRLVQICLIGYCLSGPLVGLTGSVVALFLALLVWGAFQGTLDVAMNTQAITVERETARPLMNGMHASWSVGAFAGAGIGALGVAAGVSLSRQLLALGTVALLVAGWLSTRMLIDASKEPPAPRVVGTRRTSAAVLILGGIAFASMLCEGAAADWSAVYLRESLDASVAVAGLGYTAFALGMVGVRFLGNRLLARYGSALLLPLLSGMATIGFGLALVVGAPWAAIVGLFLLGLGVGTVVPAAFSAAGRLPGVHPGVGVAAVSGLGWAGFVCGPPVIGQLAGATSLPTALALVPVLTAGIAIATRRVGNANDL
ncbi:MAG TPA: MFS transporter [Jatrophihabitans sp.]|nr:MFS transporter [Jatrophihabitans sp.]